MNRVLRRTVERPGHHVEIWIGGTFGDPTETWGWQCFTCGGEADGFEDADAADSAADDHRRETADADD